MCVGRLTKEQIKAGYSALQCIASCVDKAVFGPQLTAACNDFYTRIPHYFGSDTTKVCHHIQFVVVSYKIYLSYGKLLS